eukprot:TRINITY_DN507_c0_g1_i1.p1 TRINITY_DN507_c0_g1~~TRINITY_DN507_c0_g1_i1.p1  ORF type:complete len:109 (-),score=3.36 TRINITY_DN507_c0_g1_i1:42-368(-)
MILSFFLAFTSLFVLSKCCSCAGDIPECGKSKCNIVNVNTYTCNQNLTAILSTTPKLRTSCDIMKLSGTSNTTICTVAPDASAWDDEVAVVCHNPGTCIVKALSLIHI